jgi:hypothetical protein
MLSMHMARKSAGFTALPLAARAENGKKQEQRLTSQNSPLGRYCGSGFGTERRRIAAQARAVASEPIDRASCTAARQYAIDPEPAPLRHIWRSMIASR